jgi:hypothetical protein
MNTCGALHAHSQRPVRHRSGCSRVRTCVQAAVPVTCTKQAPSGCSPAMRTCTGRSAATAGRCCTHNGPAKFRLAFAHRRHTAATTISQNRATASCTQAHRSHCSHKGRMRKRSVCMQSRVARRCYSSTWHHMALPASWSCLVTGLPLRGLRMLCPLAGTWRMPRGMRWVPLRSAAWGANVGQDFQTAAIVTLLDWWGVPNCLPIRCVSGSAHVHS